MLPWAAWSRWKKSSHTLILGWVTPVTQAAMRVTWVSPGGECGQNGLITWGRYGGKRCWSVLCDWAHRCCDTASHFDYGICRTDVCVLNHGQHEILRHFQGSKFFTRDQRFRLETPGWAVLNYWRNAMSPTEIERQWERIMRATFVVRNRE